MNPLTVWSFTDEELYFGKISGADRLVNGNTLICEGILECGKSPLMEKLFGNMKANASLMEGLWL